MKQFRIFIDLDKEEDYLNEKARQGWFLKKRSMLGTYHFVQGEFRQLNYKVDYRIFKKKEDFNNYVSLFEDAGFKHVSGSYYSGCQYFLPANQEASREIFSDKESSAQRYLRLQQNFMFWLTMMIIYIIVDFISVGFNLSDLFFLTPGLWEMQGARFWKAFWFEFPFMLMRVVPVVFFAVVAVLNAFLAVKVKKIYSKKIIQGENQCL